MSLSVSIIIPAYNAARFLERAYASAIEQTGVDFEVILVDNNSTDDTWAIMQRLRAAHPDVVRISRETVQGAAAARNHGARLATGIWLQFLDADDVLLEGKLDRQLDLVKDSDSWLMGAFGVFGAENKYSEVPVGNDPWVGLLLTGQVGCVHANLFRRTTYLEYNGMSTFLPDHEDYDLYFRLLAGMEPYAVDSVVSCHYLRNEGVLTLSMRDNEGRVRRRTEFVGRVCRYLAERQHEYFQTHEALLNSAKLKSVIQQATYDRVGARKVFQKWFPGGVSAHAFNPGFLPRNFAAYRIFGYSLAEALRHRVRSLLAILRS